MHCSLITPSRKYYNYYGLQIVLQLLEEGELFVQKAPRNTLITVPTSEPTKVIKAKMEALSF